MEHKEKIPEEVKAEVQKAIDEVKAVQESEDAEDIKAKVQALQVSIPLSRVGVGRVVEVGDAGQGKIRSLMFICGGGERSLA